MTKKPRKRKKPDFEPIQCPNCGMTEMKVGSTVQLEELSRDGIAPWKVNGRVKLVRCLHGRCCNCGAVVDTIKQDIPVQFASITCPNCQLADHLEGEVRKLRLKDQAYQFRATFFCSHCNKKHKIRKILDKIWSAVRLKVSLTGVELELEKEITS